MIHLFTSFAIANKNLLGYDPTIEHIVVLYFSDVGTGVMVLKLGIQYKYTLAGVTYITEGEPLLDFQAHCIEGHCTHVWKIHSETEPC
jgi:hypothetical protein